MMHNSAQPGEILRGVIEALGRLAMQANYDLWQAQQHEQPPVRSLAATD